MRDYEPWHLPPDLAIVLVAALWLAVAATLAVMAVRVLGVRLAIARMPLIETAAIATLRRGQRTLLVGLALCVLVAPLALVGTLAGYHVRLASGVTEHARLLDKHVSTGRVREQRIRVRTRAAGIVSLHAMPARYDAARRGDVVAVVVVPGRAWATQLGPRPTAHFALVLFAALFAFVPVANVLVLPYRPSALLARDDD